MKKILVTGVGGSIGGVGQKIVTKLLAAKLPVRAMMHREGPMADILRGQGAEVVTGDLTNLADVNHALEGVGRLYFGMGVSPQYLEATANIAAVALHRNLEAFVNISQMTVSEMSITETTPSPQQKLHWLSEQILNWSGLPVVHVRATVFMENPLFLLGSAESIRKNNEIRLPFASSKTSPIAAEDVATAAAKILENPASSIGHIYELTGAAAQDMHEIAADYSRALERPIKYIDVDYDQWKSDDFAKMKLPTHVGDHIATMAKLHQQGRYARYTEDFEKLTGRKPMSFETWVGTQKDIFA